MVIPYCQYGIKLTLGKTRHTQAKHAQQRASQCNQICSFLDLGLLGVRFGDLCYHKISNSVLVEID